MNNTFLESKVLSDIFKNFELEKLLRGKELRSQLMKMIADELELLPHIINPYSKIIEQVHNATLIHDDIIDIASTRRASPTLNSQYGNKIAVLSGDFLLAQSMYELCQFAPPTLVGELALTLKDLVEGELEQDKENDIYIWNKKSYEKIAIKKTGSLFRWCFITPFILKNKNSCEIETARLVGERLGYIYQILDDIMDFNTLSNKSPFKDISNWNINRVLIELQSLNFVIAEQIREKSQNFKPDDIARSALSEAIETCCNLLSQQILQLKLEMKKIALKKSFDFIEREISNQLEQFKTRLNNENNSQIFSFN